MIEHKPQPLAIKRIIDCKCGANTIKVNYSGEYGSVECSECKHIIKGFMEMKDLMYKWNIENTKFEETI